MPSMDVKEIRLDSAVFQVNAEYKEEADQEGFIYRLKTKNDLDTERRLLFVRLGVETPAKEEYPNYPFYFDLTFVGVFEFSESIEEELRKQYATINCPAIIFPYLREALADLTRRADFPPLHLPITNFIKLAKKDVAKQKRHSAMDESLPKKKSTKKSS